MEENWDSFACFSYDLICNAGLVIRFLLIIQILWLEKIGN